MSAASSSRPLVRAAPHSRVADTARSASRCRCAHARGLSSSARAREPVLTSAHARRPSASARRPSSTVSESEMAFFGGLAGRGEWWRETGELGLLHRMNEARVGFLRDRRRMDEASPDAARAGPSSAVDVDGPAFLDGLTALDVGCGGGIFSEVLARLGAETTAIDASAANILAAQAHASSDPTASLSYRQTTAEDLADTGAQFDLVCAMEVLEHVEQPRLFLDALARMTKPGGHLVLSTISRTPLARFLTITAAEDRVFGLVSPGTHTYAKFVRPTELDGWLEGRRNERWDGVETRGCLYDPLAGRWRLMPRRGGVVAAITQQANFFWAARRALD